jgi:hypothetical protein
MKSLLALPRKPKYVIEIKRPPKAFSPTERVSPTNGEVGGGADKIERPVGLFPFA